MKKQLITIALSSLVILSGCGGGGGGKAQDRSANIDGDPALELLRAYQSDSPSAAAALDCVTLYKKNQSCLVSDIAPLGYVTSQNVTVEDIAARLVVSHAWMGDNFVSALREMPQDLLNLFRSVNAVVLSYEVRPSFYHSGTASLYIDPRYLWLSDSQWRDIYQQDDYRDAYQSQLKFITANRYLDPYGDYVLTSNTYDVDYNASRNLEQITRGLYRLLAHELAHANDYLPQDTLADLDTSQTVWWNIQRRIPANSELNRDQPLSSTMLHQMAQVSFRGEKPTQEQLQFDAATMGNEFEFDGAADFYAYSSQAEDVAMLFEAFMMHKEYQATSDVAFLVEPTVSDPNCDDYKIGWGQRDRLADSLVKARAKQVAERILLRDLGTEFSHIDENTDPLPFGAGWCEAQSYFVSGKPIIKSVQQAQSRFFFRDDFSRE
ncbi:hypothetical protein [Photobacterium rosenbergii]|uniref:Lipoprotein n=1 Tax=Photobacterium rosenbergii TaxID=294936 RepID=A0ABU3ZMW8_9GAMM|nr:hypothetical protein [Photobacterium rosenbergii]MDV5171464.1 hypothetical protein [Photobacterium rosenbergii]